MTLKVIGFEGWADDSVWVTYGAAALSDDEYLYNPVTGAKVAISEWEQLCADRMVTPIRRPCLLWEGFSPCYVLRVRSNTDTDKTLLSGMLDNSLFADVVSWQDAPWSLWLFPSMGALNKMVWPLARLLRERAARLLADATVLDPWEGKTQEEWCASRWEAG